MSPPVESYYVTRATLALDSVFAPLHIAMAPLSRPTEQSAALFKIHITLLFTIMLLTAFTVGQTAYLLNINVLSFTGNNSNKTTTKTHSWSTLPPTSASSSLAFVVVTVVGITTHVLPFVVEITTHVLPSSERIVTLVLLLCCGKTPSSLHNDDL